MKKKRRKLRPLALLLALTLVFSGIEISTSGTEEAEAATTECSVCGDGYGAHQVGSSISAWATGSGKSTILNWSESTDTSKTAHIIQTSDGTKYLAWYQRNKTATNKAHYTTMGYHLTASKYALDGTSIVMGNPDAKIMTGSGFNQITMGTVPSNSAEHYTLYYVSYDKVIKMCKELGLSLVKTGNGTAYRVYLQPYISCYDTSGSRVLTSGSSYSTVYSMFCKLYSAATQADLKEKYNVYLTIPAVEIPVVVRYWDVSNPDDTTPMYRSTGAEMQFDTGITVTVCSILDKTEVYYTSIDFNEALDSLSEKLLNATKEIYYSDGKKTTSLGKGLFVGCQAVIGTTSTTKFVENLDSAVGFKAETLAKLSELSTTEKYTVARDHRDKETSLKGMDVTAERLMNSILASCVFDEVQRTDSGKIKTTDACYLDLEYMRMKKEEYTYSVTRTTADYDPATGKYSNTKSQKDLIETTKLSDANQTDDGKFTKTIGSTNYPDYTTSATTDALGNMIVNGHIYTLSQGQLRVTGEGSSKAAAWYNTNSKATAWLGSSKLSTIGDEYAYNTTALTKALKSYRYYTDSAKISSYGDSAEWDIHLWYVCRPPLVRLNYKYDKTTKRYTLIGTSPASLDSSDDLEYEFANSSISKSVETKQNGLPLQQVYVTTGEVKPYDGSDSFGTSVLPEDDVILEKNLTASDRAKSKYSVDFTMQYDTTFIVCIYGDEVPADRQNAPGYTRVILDKTPDGYTVRSSDFIKDADPDATEVTVSFDKNDLVDVGHDYADKNKPDIPDSYPSKPDGDWGGKAKDTYDYTSPDKPDLDKNLIVYAIYESSAPGYTRVLINHTEDDEYVVTSAEFVPDSDSSATSVRVSFSTDGLEDVGYTYASRNKPSIPSSYSSKPSAAWGQGTPGTYYYTDSSYPTLKQNLVIYAIYDNKTPNPDETVWEEVERIEGPEPEHADGDDSSTAKGLGISSDAEDMRAWILNDYKASTNPDYETEVAIPTSEYLNTFARVRKYLTKLVQDEHTVHWKKEIIVTENHYEWHSCMYCSGWYLAGTITHSIPVERYTIYYSMVDGNVLTPIDCTVFNDTLTLLEQVTMQGQNKYWENGQLMFRLLEAAELKYPTNYNPTISSYGSYASDSTVRAAAEGAVGTFYSHNDVVQFGNGEGAWTDLSDAVFRQINDPIRQAPDAEYTSIEEGERVFDQWGIFIPADRKNGIVVVSIFVFHICKFLYCLIELSPNSVFMYLCIVVKL